MSGESGGQQNQGGQGGQSRRGRPQNQGGGASPGVGDIFDREDTKEEVKFGVVFFAVLGLGIGLGALLLDILDEPPGLSFLASVVWVILPVLGAIVGLRISEQLGDIPNNLAYATAAVAGFVGTIVFGLITWLFGQIVYEVWAGIGDLISVWVAFGIATAVVAAAAIAVERTL